jgi:hypothetical protein
LTIYRQGEAIIFISIISGPIYWHIDYSLGIGDARKTQKICKTSFVKVRIAYSANIHIGTGITPQVVPAFQKNLKGFG